MPEIAEVARACGAHEQYDSTCIHCHVLNCEAEYCKAQAELAEDEQTWPPDTCTCPDPLVSDDQRAGCPLHGEFPAGDPFAPSAIPCPVCGEMLDRIDGYNRACQSCGAEINDELDDQLRADLGAYPRVVDRAAGLAAAGLRQVGTEPNGLPRYEVDGLSALQDFIAGDLLAQHRRRVWPRKTLAIGITVGLYGSALVLAPAILTAHAGAVIYNILWPRVRTYEVELPEFSISLEAEMTPDLAETFGVL